MEQLLQVRKLAKQKRPEFIRQDIPKRMKLKLKWRKPKGAHSKIRHNMRGRRKMPTVGYRGPTEVRGMHDSGLHIINVSNIGQLKNLDAKKDGIIVSSAVGKKKRLVIFQKAKEMQLQVLNLNIDEQISKINDFVSAKKKQKEDSKKKEEKKKAEEKKKEKVEEKKDVPQLTDEQKKEAEKKEMDKVLTQKA